MAIQGEIKQYNGPFNKSDRIQTEGHCLIGISISQDDFMKKAIPKSEQQEGSNFSFCINNQLIQMGKTYIYQSGQAIDSGLFGNTTIISFPQGAPSSLKVNVVYY